MEFAKKLLNNKPLLAGIIIGFVGMIFSLKVMCTPAPEVPQVLTAERLAELEIVMRTGDENARMTAVQEMGTAGGELAIAPLVKALMDESGSVARAAQGALKMIGMPAVPALIESLRSEFTDVRTYALAGLMDITGQYFGNDPDNWQAWYDKGDLKEPTQEDLDAIELVNKYISEHPKFRAELAPKLVATGTEAAFTALVDTVGEGRGYDRKGIISALASTGDPRAIPVLVNEFRKCDAAVMKDLERAIWKFGVHGAVQLAPLMGEGGHIQGYSSQAIARWLDDDFGDNYPETRKKWTAITDEEIDILVPLLKHDIDGVRAFSARILGQTGNPKAIPPLVAYLDKKFPKQSTKSGAFTKVDARFEVVRALGNLNAKQAETKLYDIWVNFEKAYEGRKARDRYHNLAMLVTAFARARIDNDRTCREYLVEVLEAGWKRSGSRGPSEWAERLCIEMDDSIDPYLIDALQAEDEDGRAMAIRVLGIRQTPAAMKPLIEMLEDKDTGVVADASLALARLKSIEAVEPMLAALDRIERWPARHTIIHALVQIGDKRAIPALIEILKTGNTELNYASKSALQKMTGEKHGHSYEAWKKWYARTGGN